VSAMVSRRHPIRCAGSHSISAARKKLGARRMLIFASSTRGALGRVGADGATTIGFRGLLSGEHTGQVSAERREERERAFNAGKLSVLFCSPTMELGID